MLLRLGNQETSLGGGGSTISVFTRVVRFEGVGPDQCLSQLQVDGKHGPRHGFAGFT